MSIPIPEDLLDLINDIVAHEEIKREKAIEDNLEYLYLEYDEYRYEEDDLEDIIKISL